MPQQQSVPKSDTRYHFCPKPLLLELMVMGPTQPKGSQGAQFDGMSERKKAMNILQNSTSNHHCVGVVYTPMHVWCAYMHNLYLYLTNFVFLFLWPTGRLIQSPEWPLLSSCTPGSWRCWWPWIPSCPLAAMSSCMAWQTGAFSGILCTADIILSVSV